MQTSAFPRFDFTNTLSAIFVISSMVLGNDEEKN